MRGGEGEGKGWGRQGRPALRYCGKKDRCRVETSSRSCLQYKNGRVRNQRIPSLSRMVLEQGVCPQNHEMCCVGINSIRQVPQTHQAEAQEILKEFLPCVAFRFETALCVDAIRPTFRRKQLFRVESYDPPP